MTVTLLGRTGAGELALFRDHDGIMYHWSAFRGGVATRIEPDNEESTLYGAIRHDWYMDQVEFPDLEALHAYRRDKAAELLRQLGLL